MTYAGAAFVFLIGVIVFFTRRKLAALQAAVLGGSILPGCVIAEALVLIALAIAIVVAHLGGWV